MLYLSTSNLCFVALLWLVLLVKTSTASVVTYTVPDHYNRSAEFTAVVDDTDELTVIQYYEYDYTHFSLAEVGQTIEISVDCLETISSYSISPTKLDISGTVSGSTLTFNVSGSAYLIVKINDLKELVILIDDVELNQPSTSWDWVYNVTAEPFFALEGFTGLGVEHTTGVIQRVIDEAYLNGGGVVYIPAGLYHLGNLVLRSNVSLYLEGGAFFLFTGDMENYGLRAFKQDPSQAITWWIYTEFDSSNITIYGRGTFDARGKATSSESNLVSNALAPIAVTNFVLDGIIIRDTATWAITPVMSRNMSFRNFKVLNELAIRENDGIDVMYCKNVLVEHSIVISGDDSYSLKTWSKYINLGIDWPDYYTSNGNIEFRDTVAWTYCIGWKIGYGTYYENSNMLVTDSTLYQGAVGLGIDSKMGSANAAVSNVTYQNIIIESIIKGHDLEFPGWLSLVTRKFSTYIVEPVVNITATNIIIKDFGGYGGFIKGFSDEVQVSGVTLSNIYPPFSEYPASSLDDMNVTNVEYADNITIISY
ncbi:pectin lyase fold/virulence factor [Dipodascopsis uninucleata]